jgi:hypothetical protein
MATAQIRRSRTMLTAPAEVTHQRAGSQMYKKVGSMAW